LLKNDKLATISHVEKNQRDTSGSDSCLHDELGVLEQGGGRGGPACIQSL
jgi:hypothetical protein